MDTNNPVPPQIPVQPQIARSVRNYAPLGSDPAEREPLAGSIEAVDAILRQPRRVMYQLQQRGIGGFVMSMLTVALLCCIIYGVVVGTFSNGMQLWAAPIKIAGGLLVSAMICLPSLYVFTCLSGSQARLAEMCGVLTGMLLLSAILLIGFAPVAWLFSQSTESVNWMGTLHLVFWFIAAGFGLRFLDQAFSHSKARSKAGINTWAVIFLLVVVQMTTALRPIVGTAESFLPKEKKFFLSYWGDCLSRPMEAHR